MKTKGLSIICAICVLLSVCAAVFSFQAKTTAQLAGATINESGELILTYGDGTEQNLGTVVGKDGIDGKNGADGKDGVDGKDGADGKDGLNGKDGVDGKDGADGKDGVDGKDGADGKDGRDGVDGKDGKDGKDLGGEVAPSGSISAASAKGLQSAVSIITRFEKTVQSGSWRPTTQEYYSAGSGVIYRMSKEHGDAFIITNYHVVYDVNSNSGVSEDINVYLYGSELAEKAIKATYVGGSVYYDIAVLRVEDSEILMESDARAADIADSDDVCIGSTAIAIGNAQGYGISASSGIVSVASEYITMVASDEKTQISLRVMRVDTAVNSGNSGGGLYDINGHLIGIVNAKIVDDGVENIGYAIPSGVAVSIAENIIDYCYGTELESVQRAMLGVTLAISDSKAIYDAEKDIVSIEETVFVYAVSENSLAYGVMQEGDVLLRATLKGETTQITRQYHMIDMMLDVRVGDTVTVTVLRGGTEINVEFLITEDCLTSY